MTETDKQGLERAAKVARVIAEHPDLPMMCLAPSTPCDFDTYYHDVYGASVRKMLLPLEVEKAYGSSYGLNAERYYSDIDDAAEDIEDWLWDSTDVGAKTYRHEAYDMHAWIEVYRPIARMMAEDMPWHEYVVIDCF